MKEEDKQLLLKDLCARLPYGVMVEVSNEKYFGEIKEPYITELRYCLYLLDDDSVCIKPYLRRLSTMTDEEREYMEELSEFKCTPDKATRKIDFYLERHLDFRGLIEKGLALEAPEGMYEND